MEQVKIDLTSIGQSASKSKPNEDWKSVRNLLALDKTEVNEIDFSSMLLQWFICKNSQEMAKIILTHLTVKETVLSICSPLQQLFPFRFSIVLPLFLCLMTQPSEPIAAAAAGNTNSFKVWVLES